MPGAPGRVVTLVKDSDATTWGVAYRVPRLTRARVLATLDHREKGGYERQTVPVELRQEPNTTIAAITYVGDPSNPHFLGPAPLETMAAQIRGSRGPSGRNIDYLTNLRDALRGLGVRDPHVEALCLAAGIE